MPIRYEPDDARQRTVIAITGPFDPDELLHVLAQHHADGRWTHRLLYDFRHMTGELPMETLREFATAVRRRPGEPPRGAVAVVVSDPGLYARACTYAAMRRGDTRLEVFRDLKEAEAWLTKEATPPS